MNEDIVTTRPTVAVVPSMKDPDSTNSSLAMAREHLEKGCLEPAETIYRQLIEAGVRTAVTYSNLAIICRRTKRVEEAVQLLQQAIEKQPDLADLRFNLGNAFADQGEWSAAIDSFGEALHLRADFPEALFNLGNAYKALGALEEAIAAYNKALCLRPDFTEAMFNLGNSLKQQGLLNAAIYAYERGLASSPGHLEGLFNLGLALQEKGELQQAICAFLRCLDRNSEVPEALFRLGECQRLVGDHEAAATSLRKVVSLTPTSPEAHYTLGVISLEVGDHQTALQEFETAASLREDYVDAEVSRALTLLLTGRFREGWDGYDWRLSQDDGSYFHKCKAHWIVGKHVNTLLVVGEQGVGDQLMFCTMLKELGAYASEITLQVDRRLVPLLRRSRPDVSFIEPAATLEEADFDACIPMGSLCRQLRGNPEAFPLNRSAYLKAEEDRCRSLRTQLAGHGEKLIGISWFSKRKKEDLQKSVPLEDLAVALASPGVKLVSLQYGDTQAALAQLKQRTGIVVQTVPSVNNYYDLDGLAALIDACDLVVSAANLTVHLAGVLGKPTWTLLKKIPDWRWGLVGERSLWYENMTLVRQSKAGVWDDVMNEVKVRIEDSLRRSDIGAC